MIHIVPLQIQKETSTGKEEYLRARCLKYEKVLKASAPDRDAGQDESKKQGILQHLLLLADGRTAEFSLTALADLDAAPNAQSFKEKVNAVFPLIDGETLIEEQLGQAGGHIYVKQVTNLSAICFTDDSLASAAGGTEASQSSVPVPASVSNNQQEEAEALQKVAKTVIDIGKELVKAIPAPYGTVLSGVFEGFSTFLAKTTTSQNERDTEKMINRIGDLVGKLTWKANVQQTIKEQAGVIYGVIDGLSSHYGPLKKDSKTAQDRKDLVDNYLTPYLEKLDTVINTLSQSDFDMASLPEYCLAAGAYFCVLQELAVLDANHQDDPFKSTHCIEIKQVRAPRFIEYVIGTYNKIVKTAQDSASSTTEFVYAVRPFRKTVYCPTCNPPKEGGSEAFWTTLGAWYYDNQTFGSYPYGSEFCGCHTSWAYDRCVLERNNWVSGQQRDLAGLIEHDLGGLRDLALNEWSRLKTHPLYGHDRIV